MSNTAMYIRRLTHVFMGKEQIAENLSTTVVTEIIGVVVVYCIKSFLETRESEKVRLKEKEMESCTGATESEEEYE